MERNAYDALADWFEYLNDDCGYEEWSQYLLLQLQRNGAGHCGVDLGCGSGYFTRFLQRAGYEMIGIDNSAAMLSRAVELCGREGIRIPFLQEDVAAFRLPERVDFAVSVNDCFNYVPQNKLLSAFKKVHNALKKDGLFFFDVSSPEKLRTLPSVNVDDREEVTYLSFTRVEEARVTMEVSLFVREQGKQDVYTRLEETHVQFIHRAEDILSALARAGFETIGYSGHLGTPAEGADRLEFLARRM